MQSKKKKNTHMCITEVNTIADIVEASIETSIKEYHFADIHLSSIMPAILLGGHTGVPTILLDMVKVAILMEVEDNYVAIVDNMHMEIVATHLNLHTGPFIAISEPVAEFHRLCLTADVAQDSNHSLGILESNSGILDSTGIAPIHLGSHTGMAPIHLDSHTGVAALLLDSHTAD